MFKMVTFTSRLFANTPIIRCFCINNYWINAVISREFLNLLKLKSFIDDLILSFWLAFAGKATHSKLSEEKHIVGTKCFKNQNCSFDSSCWHFTCLRQVWVYWLSSVAILCHDISVCVIVHNDCDINDDEDCWRILCYVSDINQCNIQSCT